MRFFQIGILALPDAEGVTTFTAEPSPEVRAELDKAKTLWASPRTYESEALAGMRVAEYSVEGIARNSHVFGLPRGPATIRSIELEPTAETIDAWRAARLRIVWDQDEDGERGRRPPVRLRFRLAPAHPRPISRS